MVDIIEDKDGEDAEQKYIRISLKEELARAVEGLPANQAAVLRLYFGLDGSAPITFEEIGERIGFLGSQVRQIKEKALINLRHSTRCRVLKEFLS